MTHLSNDDLLAAAENMPAHAAHLDTCAGCRERVHELRETLVAARDVDVPEPSPLFWDHFSARVRAGVADEPRARSLWNRWGVAWPAGVAVLAMAVLAVVITIDQRRSANPATNPASTVVVNEAPGPELTSLAPVADDPSWVFMTDVVGDLDWEAAGTAGLVVKPGSAERALENLTELERQAVIDVLQQELADATASSL